MPVRLIACLALMLGATGAAIAYEDFQSPSGNIACAYVDDGILRCDVMETSNRPPQPPADCDLEWGNAFEMHITSPKAERICHGDTVVNPAAPFLPYGGAWSRDGFSCISSERGLSCRNARGAGWDLSRGSQTLH